LNKNSNFHTCSRCAPCSFVLVRVRSCSAGAAGAASADKAAKQMSPLPPLVLALSPFLLLFLFPSRRRVLSRSVSLSLSLSLSLSCAGLPVGVWVCVVVVARRSGLHRITGRVSEREGASGRRGPKTAGRCGRISSK